MAKSHLPSAVSRVLNGNVSALPPPGSLLRGGLQESFEVTGSGALSRRKRDDFILEPQTSVTGLFSVIFPKRFNYLAFVAVK